jgi:RNA polymerase sigma-70 factor, ECF subfamily
MDKSLHYEIKTNVSKEDFSLESLRRGDRDEFSRLVEVYSGKLYRLSLKMLGNPQDAEDVLQEAFLKAFRGIKNFDGRSSLSTWLYRILTNEALMHLRRKKPEALSIEEPAEADSEEQEPLQIIDWCCMPEQELVSGEVRTQLDQLIQELPASLRVVFLLRDVDELSTQETAEVLELSETAVKTRLSRARMKLREDLTAYFGERMAGGMSYGTR